MKPLLGRFFLWVMGWRSDAKAAPPHDKYVMAVGPHTTNWDFPILLAFSWVYGVKLAWVGKHTLFKGPLGWLLYRLGGIPVIRDQRKGVVAQLVERFEASPKLVLAIPPEGTRAYSEYWRSGFYHIAVQAKVPIVLGTLNWSTKVGDYSEGIWPSGDIVKDMEIFRAFWAGKTGKFSDQVGPVRVAEEDRANANSDET